jgi:hypothetical protein
MTRKIKQYKPIGFGDRPDPDTVEGHRNRMAEAAKIPTYNQRRKELAAEDEAKREVCFPKCLDSSPSNYGDIDVPLTQSVHVYSYDDRSEVVTVFRLT